MKIEASKNQWVKDFLQRCSSKSSHKSTKTGLNRFFEFIYLKKGVLPQEVDFLNFTEIYFGEKVVATGPITELFISDFHSYRYSLGDSLRTYYDQILLIRRFFKFVLDREPSLLSNPAQNILVPKLPKKVNEERFFTLEETIAILVTAAKEGLAIFTLVFFLFATGSRPGETSNVLVHNLDFNLRYAFVNGKSGCRKRPIIKGLEETIKLYLNSDYFLKQSKVSKERYLFFSFKENDGSPITTEEINEIIKRISLKARISKKDVTTYFTRRTFANLLAAEGVVTAIIQQIMDHDKIKNTEQYIAAHFKYNDVRKMVNSSSLAQSVYRMQAKRYKVLTNSVRK